jgi:hypothetical protein
MELHAIQYLYGAFSHDLTFFVLRRLYKSSRRAISWAVNVAQLLVFSSIFLVHIVLATLLPATPNKLRLRSYSNMIPLYRGNFLRLVVCYFELCTLDGAGLVKEENAAETDNLSYDL